MKIKNISRIITGIMTVVINCLGIFNTAWAEPSVATAMFISPMSQKILLTPGETYEGTIIVANSSAAQTDLTYGLSVGPYSITKGANSKDDYGDVDISNRNSLNIMMDWITFRNDTGVVAPNESVDVPFYINVPMDAPAGAQYATILVTDISQSASKEGDVNIKESTQIASTIFANVAGKTIEKGSISDNNIPSFLTTGPLETTSMVENEGNIYTDAEYTLQVWPMFSEEEICTNEENPNLSIVLPNTKKYYTQTCTLPMVGIFRAKQIVSIFGETSIVEKTVIVCPVWLMFLIFFAVIALILWIILKVRSHGKAKSHKDAE